MLNKLDFYIDGRWVPPVEPRSLDVINPATESVYGRISLGSARDVDVAGEDALPHPFPLGRDAGDDAAFVVGGAIAGDPAAGLELGDLVAESAARHDERVGELRHADAGIACV